MAQYTTMTVRDLIRRSMVAAGILAQGENPSADDAQEALITLNELIERWSTESLMILGSSTVDHVLVPNQARYTVGPTGDIITPYNVHGLESVVLIDYTNPNSEYRQTLQELSDARFESMQSQNVVDTYPRYYNFNRAYPLSFLSLWLTPAYAHTLRLTYKGIISGFANLNNIVDLPVGYMRALRYNLAADLAAEYKLAMDPYFVGLAIQSKASIKATNAPFMQMDMDKAVLGSGRPFNWLTGE